MGLGAGIPAPCFLPWVAEGAGRPVVAVSFGARQHLQQWKKAHHLGTCQDLRSACCWLPLWKPRVLRGSRGEEASRGRGAAAEAASTRLKPCALSAEQLTFMQYILKSSLRYSSGSGASWLPLAACSLTAVASFCACCSRHTVVCEELTCNHSRLLEWAGGMPHRMYCWVMQIQVLPRSCNRQPEQAGAAIFPEVMCLTHLSCLSIEA